MCNDPVSCTSANFCSSFAVALRFGVNVHNKCSVDEKAFSLVLSVKAVQNSAVGSYANDGSTIKLVNQSDIPSWAFCRDLSFHHYVERYELRIVQRAIRGTILAFGFRAA